MRALVLSALLALPSWAFAAPRPAPAAGPQSASAAVPVTLGQSVIKLYGPWHFHVGDDLQWASPGFDDSRWETVDLRPTPQTAVPAIPFSDFVTGWQQRGHPGYAGFAWYRLRVRLSGASGPLTILGPAWFEGGYQIFVNGRPVGSFGDFTRQPPELYFENPASFTVPASDCQPTPDGTVLIAFRFYTPADALVSPVMGGMHVPPQLGLPTAASATFHVEWETEYWRLGTALGACLVWFLFAVLIAMIFAFSREDKILLWPLAACTSNMIFAALVFSTNSQWLSYVPLGALISLTSTLAWYLWILTWWAYFGLQRRRWLFHAIVVLAVIDLVSSEFSVFAPRLGGNLHPLMSALDVLALGISATSFLLMAAIAWLGWKSVERARWPLYAALFFSEVGDLDPLLNQLHVRTNWLFFGMQFPFALICAIAMLFFFSIVLFEQFRSSMQRQQATEDDLIQAREVQSLLIPREAPRVPGWRIESEYRPARQVGGDFFQILPASDGSLLIVVGDVSGKGLRAAMTVSAIVGALRDCSERRPAHVLAHLNRVLRGQISGFVTCCAALITIDGIMTIANAGHLAPYLNGKELAVENALPLGLIVESAYTETALSLPTNARLTFLTDGVLEARNTTGELFGFERTAAIANKPAEEIATAAQSFGQEDDITVLTLTLSPAEVMLA